MYVIYDAIIDKILCNGGTWVQFSRDGILPVGYNLTLFKTEKEAVSKIVQLTEALKLYGGKVGFTIMEVELISFYKLSDVTDENILKLVKDANK